MARGKVENKKVLIIAYYWPPSGGSGVQRWLKFVKYLPQFGWEPYVFTPENPSFDVRDESLLKDVPDEAEVIHFPIWEPYKIFFKVSAATGSKTSAKPSELVKGKKRTLFETVATWVRGNLIVPDPRIFWVKPSVKFLSDYLKENKINKIITTGPPHSMHLIGYQLKKKNPSLTWLADFRDPWSEWGFLDTLMVGKYARRLHKKLEYKVLASADIVTTITPFYVRQFEQLGNRPVNLLTNGFDEDDFRSVEVRKVEKFIIRHVGIVNEKCDPRPFVEALRQLIADNKEFAKDVLLEFLGEVHVDFKNFVLSLPEVSAITKFSPAVPHKKLMEIYGTSAIHLLVLHGYKNAEGYLPGKVFEYLATGLPILGIGPEDGDAGEVLNHAGTGKMIAHNDTVAIKQYLLKTYLQWSKGEVKLSNGAHESYSRRMLTRSLVGLLENSNNHFEK